MAKVRISRSDESINQFMAYGIYIDGKKVGALHNEKTLDCKVTPGQHTIHARLDWLQSPPLAFEVAPDDTRTFVVSSLQNANWLMLALFLVVLFNTLRFLFNIDHPLLLVLLVPAMAVLGYFMTVGKKKYLFISEEKITPTDKPSDPASHLQLM
jgi:hypothetical protein